MNKLPLTMGLTLLLAAGSANADRAHLITCAKQFREGADAKSYLAGRVVAPSVQPGPEGFYIFDKESTTFCRFPAGGDPGQEYFAEVNITGSNVGPNGVRGYVYYHRESGHTL